jgi:hypothetical protein
MTMKYPLIAALGALAATLACGGDKSPSPAAPSQVATTAAGDSAAAADGSTLKVPAPTLVKPANGATLTDFEIVLQVNPVTAKFTDVSTFAYRFQLLLNGQVVRDFRTSSSTQWTPEDLDSDVTYGWRARAEQGAYFGPWSETWTFKTPDKPEGYISGGELYDPLTNGKTVGIIRGSVTFIPNVGARINNSGSYIEYHLPQTVAGGEYSMLVTGMPTNTEGNKTKVMSMSQGGSDITTNDRRFTIEKRGDPPGVVAWRIITSTDQIDTTGGERVARTFDPNKVYFWAAEWGGNRFNLLIQEGGVGGKTIYNFGKHYGGVYDPNPHYAYVGGPGGRAGADSGSVYPMVVRQVWLSSRPRPSFANQ